MNERWIAIGDIHGCATALRTLLAAVNPTSEDVVISLGDVIDRGPDSHSVVEQLIELSSRCHFHGVLGNHEEMLLSLLDGKTSLNYWLQFGGAVTLDSYGFEGDLGVIPDLHITFLRNFRDYVVGQKYFFVHANYDPHLDLDRQSPRILRWRSLDEFFPAPHCSGKIAVVGHTAERSGDAFITKHLICIDTHCYGGGWLTALDVTQGMIWQANEEGAVRTRGLR